MGTAPRSRSIPVAGSAAIHLIGLLILLQVRSPLESSQPRYTATQLYLPAPAPVVAAASKLLPELPPAKLPLVAPTPSLPPLHLHVPKPLANLPAPPELSPTR